MKQNNHENFEDATQEELLGIMRQFLDNLEQDPWWAEEFRKYDQYKQAIRDLHGREPTSEECAWYLETQGPQD